MTEDEIEGALALMETMTRDDLKGPEFEDAYTDALAEIIKSKREDKPLPETPEPEAEAGQLVDLLAALQESVAKARTARGEEAEVAEVHELPKKKTAAKKTTKKQPAKKTASKKTAGRLALFISSGSGSLSVTRARWVMFAGRPVGPKVGLRCRRWGSRVGSSAVQRAGTVRRRRLCPGPWSKVLCE